MNIQRDRIEVDSSLRITCISGNETLSAQLLPDSAIALAKALTQFAEEAKASDAREFILEWLANEGGEIDWVYIVIEAEFRGISPATLERARRVLTLTGEVRVHVVEDGSDKFEILRTGDPHRPRSFVV